MAPSRGDICNKWSRYCYGCGERFHINELRQMDGNECCPGESFGRDSTKVSA